MKKSIMELDDDFIYELVRIPIVKPDTFICCGVVFYPTGPFLSKEIREIGNSVSIYGRNFEECIRTMSELANGVGLRVSNFSPRFGFARPNGDIVIDKKKAYKMAVADGISNSKNELTEEDMILSYGKQRKVLFPFGFHSYFRRLCNRTR